jgi:glycosyltransferase involved in cell wall biosynthesis
MDREKDNNIPKVQVLLSAYNGEKYIRTQIESILNQDYGNIEILVRDDGSGDGTADILKEYASAGKITCYSGLNMGVIRSFFDLFRHADPEAEFYALSDQDDEWMPEKMSAAINRLLQMGGKGKEDIPLLYCGAQVISHEDLTPIKNPVSRIVNRLSFGNALVQNICTGCTAAFDKNLLRRLNAYEPEHAVLHDWWIYLAASCFGQVYYDQKAYIYYRQHGNNVYGALRNQRQLFKYRFSQLNKKRGRIYEQAEEFEEAFGYQMNKENLALTDKLLGARKSLRGKIRAASDKRLFRQKKSDNLVLKLIILTGKL